MEHGQVAADFFIDGDVTDVDVAACGTTRRVAVASSNGIIVYTYDNATGTKFSTLLASNHEGRAMSASFVSPQPATGTALVAGDERGNIMSWNRNLAPNGFVPNIHRKAIHSLHCGPRQLTGKPTVVTASDDRDLVLRSIDLRKEYMRVDAHYAWIEQMKVPESAAGFGSVVVADRVGITVWSCDSKQVQWRIRGRLSADCSALETRGYGLIIGALYNTGIAILCGGRLIRHSAKHGEPIASAITDQDGEATVWWAEKDCIKYWRMSAQAPTLAIKLGLPVLRMAATRDDQAPTVVLSDGSVLELGR